MSRLAWAPSQLCQVEGPCSSAVNLSGDAGQLLALAVGLGLLLGLLLCLLSAWRS